MKWLIALILLVILFNCGQEKSLYLQEGTRVIFADSSKAAEIVSREDTYTAMLGSYDRSASLKTDQEVSHVQFINHLAKNVRNWSSEEKFLLEQLSGKVKESFAELDLNLPEEIIFIKTTSDEYGGMSSAYTRMNAIMFTEKLLVNTSAEDKRLLKIYFHEIFHVYSRHNPVKKKALYKLIGYEQTNEIKLPEEWHNRRITNPDAPEINTMIELQVDGKPAFYTPVLYASDPLYDTKKDGGVFQTVNFQLFLLQNKNDTWQPVFLDGYPVFLDPENIDMYWSKIGRNTQYIIHPEEIMASNFELLMLKEKDVPNPEILEKMKEVL